MKIIANVKNKIADLRAKRSGEIKYLDKIGQAMYEGYLADKSTKDFDVSENGVVTERVAGKDGMIRRVTQPIRSNSVFMADYVSESYEGVITDDDQKSKYVYVTITSDVQDIDNVEYSGLIKDGETYEQIEKYPSRKQMKTIHKLVDEFEKMLVKEQAQEK